MMRLFLFNDVFLFLRYLFYLMMCLIFKALFSTPLIPIAPPFPITLIHSFQTLKFLSNSKISFTFQNI